MRVIRLTSVLIDLEWRLGLEVAGSVGWRPEEFGLEALVALAKYPKRDSRGIYRSKAAIAVGE